MSQVLFGSVTRIAERPTRPSHTSPWRERHGRRETVAVVEALPRDGETEKFELGAGQMCTSMAGDLFVGAFARCFPMLKPPVRTRSSAKTLLMRSMTGGSCVRALTSKSRFSKDLLPLRPLGHGMFEGSQGG